MKSSTRSTNSCTVGHITVAPCEILLKVPSSPDLSELWKPPTSNDSVPSYVAALSDPTEHGRLVQKYLSYRSVLHDKVAQLSIVTQWGWGLVRESPTRGHEVAEVAGLARATNRPMAHPFLAPSLHFVSVSDAVFSLPPTLPRLCSGQGVPISKRDSGTEEGSRYQNQPPFLSSSWGFLPM